MNFSTKSSQYHNPVRRLDFKDNESSHSFELDSASPMKLEELLNKISDQENRLLGRKQPSSSQSKIKEDTPPVPRYLLPTTASSLPPYLHSESERVRNSYRTGSYFSLKKLPDKLDCGQIDLHRKQHVIDNLITQPEQTFRPAATCKSQTYFKPYHHVGTDYEKETLLHKDLVEEEKIRIDSYARKPFVTSSRIRSKYEEMGNDAGPMVANLGPGGDNKRLELLTRDDLLDEEKYIYGRFNLFGGGGGKMPKNAVSQHKKQFFLRVKKRLTAQLQKDFPDFQFRIRWNKENEEVLVQFNVPAEFVREGVPRKNKRRADAEHGEEQDEEASELGLRKGFPVAVLTKYMHHVVNHGVGFDFSLQKRGNCWGAVTRDYALAEDQQTLNPDTIATNTNDQDHNELAASSSSSKMIVRLRSLEEAGFDSSLPTMMNQEFTEEAIQAHIARMISNLQLSSDSDPPSGASESAGAEPAPAPTPTPTTPHPKHASNSRASYSMRPGLTTMIEEGEEEEDDWASRLTGGASARLSRSARSGSRSQKSLLMGVGSASGSYSAPSLLLRSEALATTPPPASSRSTLPAQTLPVAYYVTFAMCAPWVNSVAQTIHQVEAAKHRAQAKLYRHHRQQKYSLLAPLPTALVQNQPTADILSPAGGNDNFTADQSGIGPGLSMANMFVSSLFGPGGADAAGPLRKSALMRQSPNTRNSINVQNISSSNLVNPGMGMKAANKPMSVRSILLSQQ